MQAAIAAQPKLTPVAKAMLAEGGYAAPGQGSGPGGRVMSKDLVKEGATAGLDTPVRRGSGQAIRTGESEGAGATHASPDEVEIIPVKGVRKVIAERML